MADDSYLDALGDPAAQGGTSLGVAPPPNLLSTTLGPDGQTEKPKNPYIERLFRRPRLSPSEGVERSLFDRLLMNAESAKQNSPLHATEAFLYGNLPEQFDPRNPMEVEHTLRYNRIKRKSEEYEAMRPARTPLEYLAAGAGQVIGAVQDPTNLVGPTTKFVQAGRTVAERIFRSGASGVAINAALDPVVQGLRVQSGLQERYEPRQTALSLSLGFALPAAGQGVVEALKPAARVVAGTEAKASPEAARAAREALSPDAPYARQVPPPEPLKPVATMGALSPEDAARKIDEAAAALRAEADIASDVAPAFPDRPVVAETAVTPAIPLRQEIDGKAVIFPDPQHARLYSLGRVLSEGAAPDGAELQGLAKEFQGFGVETVDDLAVVARDYHAGMTEQAQLSTADTLPARDILPDDAARSAWRDREIERLQESDPARAIIDEARRAAGVTYEPSVRWPVALDEVSPLKSQAMGDPRQRISELMQEQEEAGDFSDWGIRVVDSGEWQEEPRVGSILAQSRVWDNGDPTEDLLNGTSIVDVSDGSPEAIEAALGKAGIKAEPGKAFYFGDTLLLVKGTRVGSGEDAGEGVLKNAEVVAVFKKAGTGPDDLLPFEQADSAKGGIGPPEGARTERGADGKPQLVLPGAERIAPAEQAQRAADEPLRPTAAQRPMDGALFGDEAAQTDLMDLVRKPEAATTFAGERIPEFTPEAIPATPGQRAGIFMFDPAELQIDAKTFQFKAGGDVAGATPILKGVSRWNPDAAGQLVVWQRTDGKLFVADGHQRVNLAKRLLEGKTESDIRLPAVLYRESDGFSAEDVMIRAALKNIREGSGDVMDAARILRSQPSALAEISEISRTQTRQGVQLANLEDSVWRMVLNDVIEPRDGAIIGRLIDDAAVQEAAAKAIARVKPANEAEAEILVRRVVNSELVRSEDASQGSMFGDLDSPDSLVGEETRIVAQAMKVLGRDKNMLKRVAANAARIEETGSKIEREAAVEAADEANRLRAMIESLAFTKGPARDKLLEAAKGLKNGSVTAAGATESFIEGVRLATGPGDAGRSAARGGGRADADTGQGTYGFVGARRGAPFTGELDRPALGVAAGAGPAAERLHDISERVVAALGLTVRQGRITKPKALGTFSAKTGVTRLKELDAFDVLAHEGGHAFHLIPANKAEVDGLIATHSLEVQRLAYQGAKPGTEDVEGFAEWFRLWVTNPLYAAREAPAFTPDFTRWMEAERPDIFRQIVETQDAYRNWLQAPSKDLVTGDLVTSAAPKLPKRVAKAVGADRLPTGESLFSFFDRFYTWTLDSLHPVNRAVSALAKIHERNTGQRVSMNAASNAYKILRLGTNAYQAGHVDLSHGVVPYHSLDPEGPSLAEALELAVGKNWFGSWRKDELLDFGGYLVARRSIVEFQRFLAGEVPNPPGKLTLGDYRQAVRDYETESPNFVRAAELYYEWHRNLLRKERDSGWRSPSSYENALLKKDYAPLNRDFSEKVEEVFAAGGGRGTNRQSVMKTYRGSLRSVINPIESSIAKAYDLAAFIARNDATNALDDLSRLAGPGGGAIAERIPSHQMKPIKVDLIEALRSAGKDAGLNTDDVDDLLRQAEEALGEDNLRAVLYRAGEAPEKGEPIIYGWRGGERYALRLPDKRFGKELYEAMTGLGQEQSNWVINMLAIPARVLRAGITTTAEFLGINFLRDQISAFVLNTKFIPFVSGLSGVATEIRQGKAARLYAQAGGMMGGANVASLDQARIGKSITALQKKGYAIQRLKDPREFLKLTEVTETGTRVALFKQYYDTARKQGLTEYEAVVEAAFEARDYMDFGRHGSKMLFARRIVTFLNAALQGSDKTARVLVGDLRPMARVFRGEVLSPQEKTKLARSASAWVKISTLTALSATYAALYRDDPEFQEASEYLRATHWLFKGPGGNWYIFPKPFEMATIMNLGERFAEGMMTNDPTWADKWMRSWANTLVPPMEPAGLLVPMELAMNYDTFRDKPIVPQWDLGKDPALQFNSYTSEFSKKLGAAIGVSPAKIDHLIVGWTGSWGRNALAVSNAMGDPQRRSSELYDWPVTGRFVKNLARGSDATEKFYGLISETGGRLELKNNTHKTLIDRGQEAEAASYLAGLTDDEKVWVALNAQEKADNKRMHPLRRASDVAQVLSGIRRDITNRNLVGVLSGEPITLNPSVAQAVQDQLIRAAAAEMRNAMVAVGEPGWAQRQALDVTPFYAAIRSHAPTLADEIDARLAKKKVLPFEGVRAVWPELRDRLLKDGPEAFISDLRPDAMRGGTPRRARATALQ